MASIELPINNRTLKYRLFEIVPGFLSWGALVLLVILAIFQPILCAVYLLIIFSTILLKALGVAVHTLTGSKRVKLAEQTAWDEYLMDIEAIGKNKTIIDFDGPKNYFTDRHKKILLGLKNIQHPKPSQLYHAVIIPMYNETFAVLDSTVKSLTESKTSPKCLIVFIAYEQRGGAAARNVASKLKKKYHNIFYHFDIVEHPSDIEDEVIGKGANITNAGMYLKKWVNQQAIKYSDVIVTVLDSDNRPHKQYFNHVSYEYIIHPNRKRLSYQPVSLFLNNIWDVPAPMRVVATGNSFWNIISVMRPHILRNFASHAQPMDALVEMDFWSKRTIVEDGHQYWRSYFHFKGDYSIVPVFVPIYQDAVLSDTYIKTLKAQFVQLRRWAYGASDVPFVAIRIFSKQRIVPFWAGFSRLVRLIDSHLTLACLPPLVAFGGWVPLFINSEAGRSVVANQLPEILGVVQRFALLGLMVSIFVSFKMLPPRPARYKKIRTIGMLIQWFLMPVTALVYSSLSAYYSQTRLMLGRYMTKFDVTEKASTILAGINKKQR